MKKESCINKKREGENPPPFSGESHSFDTGIAMYLKNIEAALVFNHIRFWLRNNKAKGLNFIQGRTWTYESASQISAYFGYLSEDTVRRSLKKLIDAGYLIKDNFDPNPFIRTNWYALPDENLVNCDCSPPIPRNRRLGDEPEKITENQRESKKSFDSKKQNCDPAKSPDGHAESPDVYKDKDKNSSDKNSSVSELPFGRLARFFFEKLQEINPKIKHPNFDKWSLEMKRLLITDERPEEEVRQIIAFLVEQHKNPTREFTWSQAVKSPAKLREHYASIWQEMTRVSATKAKQNTEDQKMKLIQTNSQWAKLMHENLKKKLENNHIIYFRVADNHVRLEDRARKINHILGFGENGFKETVEKFLKSRGVL